MSDEPISVLFKKKWPGQPYNAGDLAGFDQKTVDWLKSKDIADPVSKDEAAEIAAGPRGAAIERQARTSRK